MAGSTSLAKQGILCIIGGMSNEIINLKTQISECRPGRAELLNPWEFTINVPDFREAMNGDFDGYLERIVNQFRTTIVRARLQIEGD